MLFVGPAFIGGPAFGAAAILGGGTFNPSIALITGALTTAIFARWVYRLHRTARLLRDLQNPATYEVTLSQFARDLEGALDEGVLTREASVDIATASALLIQRGEQAFVADWLSKANYNLLRDPRRVLGANNEAVAWLALARVAEARKAFGKIGPVDDPQVRPIVQSTDAMILALEGKYEEALEVAAQLTRTAYPRELEPTILEVEASAYAGLDQLQRAEERLRTLVSKTDSTVLTGVIARGGPAVPIARAILTNVPYR
jgi:hypothetical protein